MTLEAENRTTRPVRATRDLSADRARYRLSGAWSDDLVPDVFRAAVARGPQRIAVVDGAVRLTFAQLDAHIDAFAAELRDAGVAAGDVVSIQLPGWWETIALTHAVLRLDAVVNPLLPSFRRQELARASAVARPAAFVVPAHYRGVDYPELVGDADDAAAILAVRAGGTSGTLQVVRTRASHAIAAPPSGPDDPAILLFTSGTSSAPKAVLHSHNTLVAEARGTAGAHGITADDAVMFCMPFAHIGGLIYAVLIPALTGSTTVLLDRWDADVALALIERERVTVQPAMPVFLRGMLAAAAFAHTDISSLRLFPMGGSAVHPRDVRDATELLGCVSKRTYGLTEMPTLTTGSADDSISALAETEGRPIGESEVRLARPDGTLTTVDSGEIECRGPELFVGYLDPADNAGAFTADDWFRTGDLGSVDAGGRLRVVGRLKDIIIRGGENISPAAIENALVRHSDVVAACVVAMPDPVYGERACAFVVAAPDFDLRAMQDHLRQSGLASFQFPERLERRASLPHTLTGKIDRGALTREAAAFGSPLP